MKLHAAIVVAATLWSGAAPAQQGTTYLRGWGSSKCEVWTAERQKTPPTIAAAQANWVFGFLGAYNFYVHQGPGSGVDEKVDQDEFLARLDRYCAANPDHILALAAYELVKALGGKN